MADYPVSNLVGLNPTAIGAGDGTTNAATTPTGKLGQVVEFSNGRYMYVKAAGTVAMYDFVKVSATNTIVSATTALLPSTEPWRCGVSDQTGFTTGQYGWVFIGPGLVTVNCAQNCALNAKLYTTATAGVVDDDSSGTVLIPGLKLIATVTTAAAAPCVADLPLSTVIA